VFAGGEREQSAHAVADDQQVAIRLWPRGQQVLEQACQLRAIGGNRQAAVVAQVERGAGEVGVQLPAEMDCARRAVGIFAFPDVCGSAEAVH